MADGAFLERTGQNVIEGENSGASDEAGVVFRSSDDMLLGDLAKASAQALHTKVYLERGIISPCDLDPDGVFRDDYVPRSLYFDVLSGGKHSAARMIRADHTGLLSLPTVRHFPDLDVGRIADVAGVSRLSYIKSGEMAELSGLVAERVPATGLENQKLPDATNVLYAGMLRHSLESGHKLWTLNTDPALIKRLGRLVGEGQIQILGKAQQYMGEPTTPAVINPQNVVREILQDTTRAGEFRAEYLRAAFAGICTKNIPEDIRDLLASRNVSVVEATPAERLLDGPKIARYAFYAAVGGYSLLRALPAAPVKEFHGSVPALWAIDVGTVVPYLWGLTEAFSGPKTSLTKKAVAAAVASLCFAAPYAYFWAEGDDYPPAVNAIVSGFIGVAVAKELISRQLSGRRERRLLDGISEISRVTSAAQNDFA